MVDSSLHRETTVRHFLNSSFWTALKVKNVSRTTKITFQMLLDHKFTVKTPGLCTDRLIIEFLTEISTPITKFESRELIRGNPLVFSSKPYFSWRSSWTMADLAARLNSRQNTRVAIVELNECSNGSDWRRRSENLQRFVIFVLIYDVLQLRGELFLV